MNKLKTYEGFWDFFKKKKKYASDSERVISIANNCKDILLELQDLGYQVDVKKSWYEDIEVGALEISIIKDHPNPKDKELHRRLLANEIIPVHRRLVRYLESEGMESPSLVHWDYGNPLTWVWEVYDPGKHKLYRALWLVAKKECTWQI